MVVRIAMTSMNQEQISAIFWHRRDLRLHDNAGLHKALMRNGKVQPVFIFDHNILQHLSADDQRVLFIYKEVHALKEAYRKLGGDLIVLYGDPAELILRTAIEYGATMVFTNRDYEPYSQERDTTLFEILQKKNIELKGAKDHVIFEKNEVVKPDGKPYTVFTSYMRRWKENLTPFHLKSYPVEKYAHRFRKPEKFTEMLQLCEIGFSDKQTVDFPAKEIDREILKNYHEARDFPATIGTSRLSLHLRFGTISIRELVQIALNTNEKFLNELIWRDFYQMILFHFPHTVNSCFKPAYNRIRWEHNDDHFQRWCNGTTGYPLVDAGMRELNATGYMHNRIRMITSGFLTKHLLLDWRLGERYFAEKLLDYELASNVGGWQWVVGCGCDAAPYFRVFNPENQQQKFDPDFRYIKKWIPEYGTAQYPSPIIDHKMARERALKRYKEGLNK